LEPVELDVAPGEFICIIGPSGCGKSTLLRLIAGLEQPTSGELAVDGTTIPGPDYTRGLVFQDPMLFPWKTVWDNVATGLEARGLLAGKRDEVDQFVELVGLADFAGVFRTSFPAGWPSGRRWPGRWSTTPRCCFWTSHWGRWMP
jgi:ABC-type nitrate/sulfonate/bicarbonate transport system ATPase subunit